MEGETESEIMASQDRALRNKYRATNISQTDRQTTYAGSVNNVMGDSRTHHIIMHSIDNITIHRETL